MKNLGKILGIILVVALLCTAFVLAISAETANEAMIVETGTQYATYADAMLAVNSGETVKLLKDIKLPAGNGASTKTIVIDLNGYTIDMSESTSALMSAGQNNDLGKHSDITFQNGKIINNGTSAIGQIKSGNDKARLTFKNIDIVTAGTEKGTWFDFNAGTSLLYNVNWTTSVTCDNAFLFIRGDAKVTVERCNFYSNVNNGGFKLGGNPTVDVINSSVIINAAASANSSYSCKMILVNAPTSNESYPVFTARNSELVVTSLQYKTAQFTDYSGKKIALNFYDCTLFASWRVFIGSNLTEAAIETQPIVYCENTNIGCGKVRTQAGASGTGGDHCLMRGAADATFNNCVIDAQLGSDIIWNSGLNADGTPRITYGEGTMIITNATKRNELLTNTTAGKIWKSPEGVSAYTLGTGTYAPLVFAKEAPKTNENMTWTTSAYFETTYLYTKPYDYSFADGKTAGNICHDVTNVDFVMRGGEVANGYTFSDNNNYFVYYTHDMTKFVGDPYFCITNFNNNKLSDTSYIVLEYDIATESEMIPNFRSYINFRGKNSAGTDGPHDRQTAVIFSPAGGNTFNVCVGDNANIMGTVEFNPGEWLHVTMVYRIGVVDATTGTSTDGSLAAYINGKLVGVNNVPAYDEIATYASQVRFHNNKGGALTGNESVCLDNVEVKFFNKAYTGTLDTIFAETPAQTLVDSTDYSWSSNYQLPAGLEVAYVNGKYYADLNAAISAANGATVELIDDAYATISVPGVINTNGYKLNYELDGTYATINGNLYTFGEYTGEEHSTIYWLESEADLDDEDFDWDAAAVNHVWGTQLVAPAGIGASYFKDGKFYEFAGFMDDYGNEYETLPISTETITEYAFYPVFEEATVLFSIEQGGIIVGYGKTFDDLINAVTNIKIDDGKATVKLYEGIEYTSNQYINVPVGATLDFDFNGQTVNGKIKNYFIRTQANSNVSIYSSVPGAKFFNKNTTNGQGGLLVTIAGTNHTSTVTIGNGTNNLATYSAVLFDSENNSATINVLGGTWTKNVSDYGGYLIARGTQTINVEGANFVATGTHAIIQANKAATYNFKDSTFFASVNGAPKNTNFFGGTVVDGTVTNFTNTKLYGYNLNNGANVTATVDKDTIAASFGANVTIPEGYKVALVNQKHTTTNNYNVFDSFEVSAHENTALINAILVTADTVLPSVSGMLQNLTLFSTAQVNLYVPALENIVAVSSALGDLTAAGRNTTINGVEYYTGIGWANANQIANELTFYITFAGEEAYAQAVTVRVVDYAAEILSRGFSTEAKELMMAMLAYSNEAYTLLNGAANAEIAAILAANAEFAPAASEIAGEKIDTSVLANAITSAQLNLDAAPDFVFTVNKAFAGTITITGAGIEKTFTVTAKGEEEAAEVISITDIRMHNIDATLTITAQPTEGAAIEGTYNLATYILGLEAADVNASFARALYTYGKVAADYKAYITATTEPEVKIPEILYGYDFNDVNDLNTTNNAEAIAAANGMWSKFTYGTEATLDGGSFNFITKDGDKFFDLRYYVEGIENKLNQDFIISFWVKPTSDKVSFQLGIGTSKGVDNKICAVSNNVIKVGDVAQDATLTKDVWTLIEIVCHYDESKGGTYAYTVLINGEKLAYTDTNNVYATVDMLRAFRYASGTFSIDNFIIAAGTESLINTINKAPGGSIE